jgi:hypothetical protein
MIEPESLDILRDGLRQRIQDDSRLLDELRNEVRQLRGNITRIQPRSTTAISLVGTDGGSNRIEFDPFMVQLIRVVDSSRNEYWLEAVTPTTDITKLSQNHIGADRKGLTPLGRMMQYLGVQHIWDLSPMIPEPPREAKPSWVQVYRELTEWAIVFSLIRERHFGTDTLIMLDGFLRSKVFTGELFARFRRGLLEGIEQQLRQNRRRIYLVGIAKHSKVLQRYRLAMALEGVLRQDYPCYVEVPRDLEAKAYVWSEYARGDEREAEGGEANKFVAGKMFFVKFGRRPHDPIWPVDLLIQQAGEAQRIIGYMLADAEEGFPVPFYPRCLQQAHENAALVDFDMDILQTQIVDAVRGVLGTHREVLDELQLLDADPSARRYR